mmetsp:Transcript_21994/g.37628  ORF Transcript_21994/g.37628 Transcript_21994/m.37628 type:complete len:206 (-) Transcript_21994:1324-1941(-)
MGMGAAGAADSVITTTGMKRRSTLLCPVARLLRTLQRASTAGMDRSSSQAVQAGVVLELQTGSFLDALQQGRQIVLKSPLQPAKDLGGTPRWQGSVGPALRPLRPLQLSPRAQVAGRGSGALASDLGWRNVCLQQLKNSSRLQETVLLWAWEGLGEEGRVPSLPLSTQQLTPSSHPTNLQRRLRQLSGGCPRHRTWRSSWPSLRT